MKIIWYLGSGLLGVRFAMLLLCTFEADIFSAEIGYTAANVISIYTFLIIGIGLVLATLFYVFVDTVGYYGEYKIKGKKVIALMGAALASEVILLLVRNLINLSTDGWDSIHIYATGLIIIFIILLGASYFICKNDYYYKLEKSGNKKITTKSYARIATFLMLIVIVAETIIIRIIF